MSHWQRQAIQSDHLVFARLACPALPQCCFLKMPDLPRAGRHLRKALALLPGRAHLRRGRLPAVRLLRLVRRVRPGEDAGFLSAALSPFPVLDPSKPVRYLNRADGVSEQRLAKRVVEWRRDRVSHNLAARAVAGGHGVSSRGAIVFASLRPHARSKAVTTSSTELPRPPPRLSVVAPCDFAR